MFDYELFTKTDAVLGHKETLNRNTKAQALQVTASDCSVMKLDIKIKGLTKISKGQSKLLGI